MMHHMRGYEVSAYDRKGAYGCVTCLKTLKCTLRPRCLHGAVQVVLPVFIAVMHCIYDCLQVQSQRLRQDVGGI